MTSPHVVSTVFGVIGNVFSFGLFLSPLPTFVAICKKKGVEELSPIPYLAALLNCMMWVIYGMPFVQPDRLLVVTMNSIGIFIEALCIATFFVFAPRNQRKKIVSILAVELIFVGVVLAGVLGGILTHDTMTTIVGIICVIIGTSMLAPLITNMREVMQTKSVKNMPVDLYVVSFLNYLCWMQYALLRSDFYVTIPNMLGVVLIAAQFVLFDPYLNPGTSKDEPNQNLELPKVAPPTASASAPDTLSSVNVEK